MINFFNIGVVHGSWGEDKAVEYLRSKGYLIVDRNTRPVKRDARLELDVVAWDRKSETIVFVEVKQHSSLTQYARRLRSINKQKTINLRRAGNAWRRLNKWDGAYRFDVIEVYGVPEGGRPIIDHILGVNLFVESSRFVSWR